jgi:hypothetical protein
MLFSNECGITKKGNAITVMSSSASLRPNRKRIESERTYEPTVAGSECRFWVGGDIFEANRRSIMRRTVAAISANDISGYKPGPEEVVSYWLSPRCILVIVNIISIFLY